MGYIYTYIPKSCNLQVMDSLSLFLHGFLLCVAQVKSEKDLIWNHHFFKTNPDEIILSHICFTQIFKFNSIFFNSI